MKALLGVLVLGVAIWSQSAVAEPRGFGFSFQAQGQREAQGQRGQPREGMQREQRDMRREGRAEPGRGERRQDRMTEDERRELRRDIDQANRDIYRQNRNR